MNLESTLQTINTRLLKSDTLKLMREIEEVLVSCPFNNLNFKKKGRREFVDNIQTGVWHLHCAQQPYKGYFEGSLVLVEGLSATPFMVEEVARYVANVMYFQEVIKLKVKASYELVDCYSKIKLKPQKLREALITDLKRLSLEHNFELDIKAVVLKFNTERDLMLKELREYL